MERVLIVVAFLVLSIVIRALLRGRRQRELERQIEHAYREAEAHAELAPPKKKKKRKKKKKEKPDTAEGEADAAATDRLRAMLEKISSAPAPRRRHYVFAHQLLQREMIGPESSFAQFRQAVESDGAVGPIDALWRGAEKVAIAMDGKVDPIDGSPKATVIDDEGVLITMPEATNVTEAIFIAVVKQPATDGGGAVRYFLLEKGALGQPVLGEWTSSAHVNYGNVDSEDEATFLAKVRHVLKDQDAN